MINKKEAISPLKTFMVILLRMTKFLSLSRWIIGKDPDNPSFILTKLIEIQKNRFINYHTFLDCYLILWFLFEIIIIISFPSGKLNSAFLGILVIFLSSVRLIELFGAQLHIIAYRREKDTEINERKILIGLMCYLEGMLIFCLIYMGLFTILSCGNVFSVRNGLSISSLNILYFSVANYTTTGFGDITAIHPTLIKISSLESIFGLLFLAFFISGLVARAFSAVEKKKK